MKKIKNIYILGLVIIIGLFSSCFKDTTIMDLMEIEGVVIDTTGMTDFSVYQFEHLIVEPNLNTSLTEENLSFEWRINLEPGDTIYETIGTERNLNFEVDFKPNVSGKKHQLLYTVTDENTGLDYIMAWPLTVKNNIGEGLVIAETSDGITTDISHIMSPQVTADYSQVSVKHHVYSSINGNRIPGLIKQMRFGNIYGVDALIGITDNSVVRINTLDYTFAGENDDLFFTSTQNYQPQALGVSVQADIYIGNGKLTSTYMGASKKFGLPFDADYSVPDHVAINPFNYYPLPVRVSFYDEEIEKFIYIPSLSSWGDRNFYETPGVTGGVFNPSNLENKINLVSGVSTEGDFRHLLKDTFTGEIGLYVLTGGVDNYPEALIPPAPKAFYDMSNAPGINEATEFVFMDNQKVLYYATSTKIYAMLYSSDSPVFEERYTVPAGEEITTLQVYTQADYPFRAEGGDSPYLETNNKQLILSTYGSEGKVYLLPLVNTGVGNIDDSNIKVFTGFDRITAITTQL
ncbi:hypothetical protein L1I30_03790 [Gillisia sp. M10.2A]|uniref:PKD-like family protein n=1 Tax=Gillisia lutea TaxID=2909668 RepID=A0ABS9ED39_9FLAO|nr:PKD-like family lipoprotein [Gillisia lutea]MCF4100780.1 hypothetical protein [Gillisia lutea]